MVQTIVMAVAAGWFVAIACFVNAHSFLQITVFQLVPSWLALALSVMAFGRYIGWPV